MGVLKSFDIKRLRPFRKSADQLTESPGEDEQMQGVDPDLKPEEVGYVRHFLRFADVFLKRDKEQEPRKNVVQMQRRIGDKAA